MALNPRAKFLITAATDFAKAERQAKTFLGSLKSSSKVALGAFATGTGVAAAGLTALALSAADSADALAKQSDKLGIATEKLAALQLAGRLTGVENQKLTLGLQRMTRRIAEAAQGAGEAQGALKELGLDARELAGLPLDQQFERVAAAMTGVDRQSDRIRLGFKLFDSEGVDLIRTLRSVETGLSGVETEAKAFGTAISRVDARRIELARDEIERAETAVQGIGTTVAIAASTVAEQLAGSFADAAVEANGFRTEINATMEAFVVGANFAVNSIRGIQVALQGARLAYLRIQESFETGGAKFAGGLAVGFGAPGAAAEINKATAQLQSQSNERVNRIREEIDETGRAIDELLGKFRTGEQAIEQFRAAQEAAILAARVSVRESQGTSGGGDDGGSLFTDREREQLAQRLAAVQATFRSEVEALRQSYVDRQTVIDEARSQELITEQEQNQLRLQNAQDLANKVLAIEKRKEDQRKQLNERTERQIQNAKRQTADLAVGLLQALGAENKAFAVAAIILEKALAIQRTLIANQVAAELAFASQLIPGDPSSLARAAAAKAAVLAQGRIAAVLIGATGAAQIASLGRGSTGAPLGTPTNPVFTDGFTRPPEDTRSQDPRIEVHFHGSGFLVTDDLRDVLREQFDSDHVIIRRNTRQAAEIRGE